MMPRRQWVRDFIDQQGYEREVRQERQDSLESLKVKVQVRCPSCKGTGEGNFLKGLLPVPCDELRRCYLCGGGGAIEKWMSLKDLKLALESAGGS